MFIIRQKIRAKYFLQNVIFSLPLLHRGFSSSALQNGLLRKNVFLIDTRVGRRHVDSARGERRVIGGAGEGGRSEEGRGGEGCGSDQRYQRRSGRGNMSWWLPGWECSPTTPSLR